MFSASTFVFRFRVGVAATGIAIFGIAASRTLLAQSPPLAEVARKEQERRKALPSATKVYTNKDVPKAPVRPADAPGTQASAAAEPSSAIPVEGPVGGNVPPAARPGGEPDQKPAAGDEAAWKKRISDAREQVRRSEMFVEALQTRINSLTQDILSRSDPAQKARLIADRKDAIAELARVKQDIERGRKQIADIEEEARQAGVPPGWLR
jgi:DNA repair exonuclease SbcCD ATPase subunit